MTGYTPIGNVNQSIVPPNSAPIFPRSFNRRGIGRMINPDESQQTTLERTIIKNDDKNLRILDRQSLIQQQADSINFNDTINSIRQLRQQN